MDLIPPFAMYFTVEQALELDITETTALDVKASAAHRITASLVSGRLVYTFWQRLTDESRSDLITAHDREYDYVSELRGLIKATAYYSNLAAREDWLRFCTAHGIDPDSIDWRTISHKKIDKHIAGLTTTQCQHCKQPIRINTNSHWVHSRTGHTACVVGNRSLGTIATPESQTGDPGFDGILSENERAEAERHKREVQATVDSIINECCGQTMDLADYKMLEQRIIAAIEYFRA